MSFTEIDQLRRDAEKLAQELAIAVQQALIGYQDPVNAAKLYEQRYAGLVKRMDEAVKTNPQADRYLTSLKTMLRKEMDSIIAHGRKAHRDRGEVQGGLQQKYNNLVGQALVGGTQSAKTEMRKQVDKTIRSLVDQVVTSNKVPAHVRSQMTRSLSDWVFQQEAVEDAFLVAQRAVVDVAAFLHEMLTIQGEIVNLRDQVKKRDSITPVEAKAADQKTGALAKRAAELDRRIQEQIRNSTLRVSPILRLDPKLVLDPARGFIDKINMQAGIKLRKSDVTVELGTKLTVLDPFRNQGLNVNPYAQAQMGLPGDGTLGVSAGYENTLQQGAWKGENFTIKATLTWSF